MTELEPGKLYIIAGEGFGEGHVTEYRGARTKRALRAGLAKERVPGERWAKLKVATATDTGICLEPISIAEAVYSAERGS